MNPIPRALTIAGSDSGGGAGIQADLKTFLALGVHGMSAITCTTAQNTLGVRSVVALPVAHIADQIDMVVTDIGVDAAKTGMLLNREIIDAVAEQIKRLHIAPLVVDPVMVSRTGARLLDEAASAGYLQALLPLASLITPNLHEAEILSGLSVHTLDDMQEAARRIHGAGAKAVLVKGGGLLSGRGTDVWFDGARIQVLASSTVITPHTHGTGCTLAAAITAYLSQGYSLFEAVLKAKEFLITALRYGLALGQGQGPVGHAWASISPPAREPL
ncbi:bifunctional hydroxymethylpyrimidine kinase/phosphomethylpyrimidine kinase [Anthocerotibacter panamensis]|uniref:bifunctional hydroxymethylpyrimidine kinase/phosphomethylpyrimidine kinase n=1 Tax=Anthocerotibacter panamensis TaxID=2857077 RepID=UPI001FD9EFB1|nr:bifunctional hydroxymethylpyrimidine kinase/phosphomethylpyrimidine kinase [Anthocerotibacter panamensis]